ncbi:MAG TPA: hydrogenase iron-sulfur subunit [Myxococcales bacterium]|jgi:F420-non-reducing hydrogenase iron-sulfur subunit
MSDRPVFEPRIVGLLCNWCAYAGADKAGADQVAFPPNVHVVRVMCTGRIDAELVLQALAKGADGVLAVGCQPGDCHYKDQNLRSIQRFEALRRMLGQAGVEPGRLRFDFVSASGSQKYRQLVAEMTAELRGVGPMRGRPPGEDSDGQEVG